MAEVIDIEIISTCDDMYKAANRVFEDFFNVKLAIKNALMMDSWSFDNIHEIGIDQIERELNKLSNNIMTIKFDSSIGEVGTYIEKKEEEYIYECWLNPNDELSEYDYKKLQKEIVNFFLNNKDIIVCGIGREVVFDYDKGLENSILESKNFDVWIVNNDELKAKLCTMSTII
ncbi:MAG: hypothetical protein IJJ59_02755 [Pseudobutyrivibrio sp.]|uniref:hypothetical protein n=1 Tax=Pseudobutyrivibrio sp. TaxID=2014367 RepID=UPI0025E18B06|nr:hypothetical protein [Pseudobutyrivibrio sp.]MBQ6462226.1 hypothetical protein [Pseudobutyrivibrio sp.]